MKPLSILLATACAMLTVGCADPLEQRTAGEVGEQIQKGVTGQGKLGPREREADDQAGEHGVPQTHP